MNLLDLCCCAGGAAEGYRRAGFTHIIGVDIRPQKRYPFEFHQDDALDVLKALVTQWSPDNAYRWGVRFDAIHVSPPCQRWAAGGNPNRQNYPDYIGEMRDLLMRIGLPYVIENVVRAPLLSTAVEVCGGALGCANHEMQIHRHRKFEANFPLVGTPCETIRPMVATITGTGTPSGFYYKHGNRSLKIAERREVMGIDWMSASELREAVPPAYTEYIGKQLLEHLKQRTAA